ncbi:hypothetical protein MN608_05127 [Microdochium nivale]|nr:hypothetical protein MN608_05127 [Microdochium nivale]
MKKSAGGRTRVRTTRHAKDNFHFHFLSLAIMSGLGKGKLNQGVKGVFIIIVSPGAWSVQVGSCLAGWVRLLEWHRLEAARTRWFAIRHATVTYIKDERRRSFQEYLLLSLIYRYRFVFC